MVIMVITVTFGRLSLSATVCLIMIIFWGESKAIQIIKCDASLLR